MPELVTPHFGAISYEQASLISFPAGLPAFEDEHAFLVIEQPETAPVVFLQSVRTPGLVFMTLPLAVIEPNYQWSVPPEDLSLLGFDAAGPADLNRDSVALVIVTVSKGSVTANTMAPILIHSRTRRGIQAVQADSLYSHQYPLGPIAEGQC